MKSPKLGAPTSKVEILNITQKGIWLYFGGREYFLPYEDFPWFKNATLSQIHHVQLEKGHYLHWKDLDVDLEVESLQAPDKYPLKYK